jgi:hypothetical protein
MENGVDAAEVITNRGGHDRAAFASGDTRRDEQVGGGWGRRVSFERW